MFVRCIDVDSRVVACVAIGLFVGTLVVVVDLYMRWVDVGSCGGDLGLYIFLAMGGVWLLKFFGNGWGVVAITLVINWVWGYGYLFGSRGDGIFHYIYIGKVWYSDMCAY